MPVPATPPKPPRSVIRKQWQRTQERWLSAGAVQVVRNNTQFFMGS